MNYDIIGDIHGHADALAALLADLGYAERRGAWRHPQRQAIFVGDYIDRGPQQREAIGIVRRMVDAGSAQAIMGNHEFNAIGWCLSDPASPGEFLRPRFGKAGEKNRRQHAAFLAEMDTDARHRECIEWFLTLPLWLELPELRAVHACWHARYMAFLKRHLTADRLTHELMIPASREPKSNAERYSAEPTIFKAVDALLKGLEVPLPSPHAFTDKDGERRTCIRVRWWAPEAVTFRDAAMLPEAARVALPQDRIPDHARIGKQGDKPLFVGHYWQDGMPQLLARNVACVDYSVARGGRLVAYRWDGEPVLDNAKFHWVGR